ncbi:MAG TPA: VOC family protein [Verrucomicrobiales bacterium]|nr:VOC family protein [Verrucomicrobiales bacterium]
MDIIDLNHVALHVRDVEDSVRFYRDQMGLQQISRPAFTFPGAWFRLGTTQELHLIGEREDRVVSGPRSTHFALRVASLDKVCRELEGRSVALLGRQVRPDGALQAYVEDPDGHCIEFTQLHPQFQHDG